MQRNLKENFSACDGSYMQNSVKYFLLHPLKKLKSKYSTLNSSILTSNVYAMKIFILQTTDIRSMQIPPSTILQLKLKCKLVPLYSSICIEIRTIELESLRIQEF